MLKLARIDPATGYRFYDSRQVPVAQVIRRFRDLDMPLDQVKAVLQAPDLEARTKEIIAHLTAMEAKLAELQMSVASLRALLEGPPVRPAVEFRSIPATPALAVRGTVSVEEAWAWAAIFGGSTAGSARPPWHRPGLAGRCSRPNSWSSRRRSTAFVPVNGPGRPGPGPRAGRVADHPGWKRR